MKRHVAAVVVALTAWLVIDSHVDWVPQDGKRLLEVSGQRWDLRGWAAEQLLQLRRDCTLAAAAAAGRLERGRSRL